MSTEEDILTREEIEQLGEIQRLLDEAYDHYFATTDGLCKMSEGYFNVSFGNYFDRDDGDTGYQSRGQKPAVRRRRMTIYSYVLGPSRNHDFESIGEALETVKKWHEAEMTRPSTQDGWEDEED